MRSQACLEAKQNKVGLKISIKNENDFTWSNCLYLVLECETITICIYCNFE